MRRRPADARTTLLAMLDGQAEAAADAGADDLYRAWQALTALAMQDMIERAQNLPQLADYTLNDVLPSAVLAQRFYQDPDRAAELAALNGVQHPLFMPRAGRRLSA